MADSPKNHRRLDVLAYKQGFLEGDQLAEFEAHLRDCAACQVTLEQVSKFLPALQQALTPRERSTEDLWAAAQAQQRANRQARKPRRNVLGLRLALSALAVSAATAVFFVAKPLLTAAGPDVVAAPQQPAGPVVDGGADDAGASVP